jgi:hypothetical protein
MDISVERRKVRLVQLTEYPSILYIKHLGTQPYNEIKFDNNPDLFAFKNKIYDLKTHSFINAKPDQYITLHTGYNYDEDYDKDRKIEKESY